MGIYHAGRSSARTSNGGGMYAANPSQTDSLPTVDDVYKYTFSNFEHAQQIMEQLRRKHVEVEYKLDIAEGDLYFNTGHYYQALRFYRRALDCEQVQDDAKQYMELLHRMISCYDCVYNETKKAQYVEMLLKKAEACGDGAMQSVALFNMGKMLYYEGNKDKGYQYMQQAVEQMARTDYKYKYDNLRYNYNTLLVFQELDERSEEALQTLNALEKVIADNVAGVVEMDDLDEKEHKAMIAHHAVILYRLGRKSEADNYYRQFLAMGQATDRDNYLIMPYLFDRGLYDEVIRMNSAREKMLSAQGDTVNYHMTTIKKSLGHAYREKGDYKTAARYYEQLAILRDSIKNREQKSAALELATVYETNEKDLQLHEQTAAIRLRTTELTFVCCVVFLLGVLLWRTQRYSRTIRRKNESMVSTIEELLGYKDELYLQKEENCILQEQLQGRGNGILTIADGEEVSYDSDKEHLPAEKPAEDETPYDRVLFNRIDHKIIYEKLFLQSNFSREELMKTISVPKNKFAQLFRQFAGTNFPKYINNLRLDYAAKMLRKYPDYTIDAVAKSCGMSTVQTFHRLFLEKFGVTPMEFRTGLKHIEK